MENLTYKHSLIDFWKIPPELVSFNKVRSVITKKNLVITMPPPNNRNKPALYQWNDAHIFIPNIGLTSKSNDISEFVSGDPSTNSITLPFNIDQAVINLLTEQYINFEAHQHLFSMTRQLFYKLKPLIPRDIQVRLRQKLVNLMGHRKFPIWELDASVDLLHRSILVKLLETNPGSSLPMISFWPQSAEMCLLLTHDVETNAGIENINKIVNIEQRHGFRSVWNFVPEQYPIDLSLLKDLKDSGFEIGVHGLHHDGRLLKSYNLFRVHADKINNYLKLWESVGFRSESNLRKLEWISELIQVEYDSSCMSTEWYGAQPGGCCTVFPFIYQNLVELPISLQQDFTLLDILKLTEDEILTHWMNTVHKIKELNGMVLINTHPDYLMSHERLRLYENFLTAMKDEMNFWHALPREAALWWSDRNSSELSSVGADWQIEGPAKDRGKVMRINLNNNALSIQPN